MDQVFAPWRIEWVERSEPDEEIDDCVFCALPDSEADRGNNLLARGEHAYVLLNNYPYNPGHAMVIPYEHTGEWGRLDDDVMLDHGRLKARTLDAMRAAMEPDGFNVGQNLGGAAAGGSVGDHLHSHVVPRWEGDTNFMPVVGDTKVIVEAVDRTYDHLRAAFAGLDGADVPDDDADAGVRFDEG